MLSSSTNNRKPPKIVLTVAAHPSSLRTVLAVQCIWVWCLGHTCCAAQLFPKSISTLLALLLLPCMARGDHKVIFPPGYSLHERPPTIDGKPVVIEASINLRNILDVAEKEQIISLETTLRLYWKV